MAKYKVVGPRPVEGHAPGEEFEHEFLPEDELRHLETGRLVIIPRAYRVIGSSQLEGPGWQAGPDEVFIAALPLGNEQALIEAGHIERAPMTEGRKKEAAKELKAELKADQTK